jgi:hypothetical protein
MSEPYKPSGQHVYITRTKFTSRTRSYTPWYRYTEGRSWYLNPLFLVSRAGLEPSGTQDKTQLIDFVNRQNAQIAPSADLRYMAGTRATSLHPKGRFAADYSPTFLRETGPRLGGPGCRDQGRLGSANPAASPRSRPSIRGEASRAVVSPRSAA